MSIPPDWQTLPPELKLEIARLVTVPSWTDRHSALGYPIVPDFDASLLAIDRESRGLFREIVEKDYLHVHLWMCRCPVHPEPRYTALINNFLRNRVRPGISRYEDSLGLNLSVMEIEMMCTPSCARKDRRIATFMASPDMMLVLYGIIQRYVAEQGFLEINTRCQHPNSTALAVKILDDMRKILCNIRLLGTSSLPQGYDLVSFQWEIGRRLTTPKALVRTREAYLEAVQCALDEGIAVEQLVSSLLLYEGEIDTENIENDDDMYGWGIWTGTRRYLFELAMNSQLAELVGISYYMLSRPLTLRDQQHFYMVLNPVVGQLQGLLDYVDRIIWTYNVMEADQTSRPPIGWLLPALFARMMFLLAWARLNTLIKTRIEGHNLNVNTPIAPDVEVLWVGDDMDEPFNSSAWGSPKSMVLVARRDIARILQWMNTLPEGSSTRELIRQKTEPWRLAADKIYGAQGIKKWSPDLAVQYLNVPFVGSTRTMKFLHLKQGAAKVALHAKLEAENWSM